MTENDGSFIEVDLQTNGIKVTSYKDQSVKNEPTETVYPFEKIYHEAAK